MSGPGNKVLQKQLSAMFQCVSQEALHYFPHHICRFDSSKILRNSTSTPKLFILCGKGYESSLKFFAEIFQSSKAQHFQIKKICSAEHFANIENPFQFNQIITDFIQTIQPTHKTREKPVQPGSVFSNLKHVVETSNNRVNLA